MAVKEIRADMIFGKIKTNIIQNNVLKSVGYQNYIITDKSYTNIMETTITANQYNSETGILTADIYKQNDHYVKNSEEFVEKRNTGYEGYHYYYHNLTMAKFTYPINISDVFDVNEDMVINYSVDVVGLDKNFPEDSAKNGITARLGKSIKVHEYNSSLDIERAFKEFMDTKQYLPYGQIFAGRMQINAINTLVMWCPIYIDMASFKKGTDLDVVQTLQESYNYPLQYTIDLQANSIKYTTEMINPNADFLLPNGNELIQNETRIDYYYDDAKNYVTKSTQGLSAVAVITTRKPVASDVSCSFFQVGGGNRGTLTIKKGNTRSNEIPVSFFLATIFSDPIPQADDTYIYMSDYSGDKHRFNMRVGDYIASRITDSYYDGKQTATFTVLLKNNDLFVSNDLIHIYDSRNKSIGLLPDGTDKIFKIISAEYYYDGAHKMNIFAREADIKDYGYIN